VEYSLPHKEALIIEAQSAIKRKPSLHPVAAIAWIQARDVEVSSVCLSIPSASDFTLAVTLHATVLLLAYNVCIFAFAVLRKKSITITCDVNQ
jgi:hypothetical protein